MVEVRILRQQCIVQTYNTIETIIGISDENPSPRPTSVPYFPEIAQLVQEDFWRGLFRPLAKNNYLLYLDSEPGIITRLLKNNYIPSCGTFPEINIYPISKGVPS